MLLPHPSRQVKTRLIALIDGKEQRNQPLKQPVRARSLL